MALQFNIDKKNNDSINNDIMICKNSDNKKKQKN